MSKNNANSVAYLDAPSLSLKSNLIMADSNQFKAGDVVRLPSGGPKMTVSSVESDGKLYCIWFVDGDVKGKTFNRTSLALVTDKESE